MKKTTMKKGNAGSSSLLLSGMAVAALAVGGFLYQRQRGGLPVLTPVEPGTGNNTAGPNITPIPTPFGVRYPVNPYPTNLWDPGMTNWLNGGSSGGLVVTPAGGTMAPTFGTDSSTTSTSGFGVKLNPLPLGGGY